VRAIARDRPLPSRMSGHALARPEEPPPCMPMRAGNGRSWSETQIAPTIRQDAIKLACQVRVEIADGPLRLADGSRNSLVDLPADLLLRRLDRVVDRVHGKALHHPGQIG